MKLPQQIIFYHAHHKVSLNVSYESKLSVTFAQRCTQFPLSSLPLLPYQHHWTVSKSSDISSNKSLHVNESFNLFCCENRTLLIRVHVELNSPVSSTNRLFPERSLGVTSRRRCCWMFQRHDDWAKIVWGFSVCGGDDCKIMDGSTDLTWTRVNGWVRVFPASVWRSALQRNINLLNWIFSYLGQFLCPSVWGFS